MKHPLAARLRLFCPSLRLTPLYHSFLSGGGYLFSMLVSTFAFGLHPGDCEEKIFGCDSKSKLVRFDTEKVAESRMFSPSFPIIDPSLCLLELFVSLTAPRAAPLLFPASPGRTQVRRIPTATVTPAVSQQQEVAERTWVDSGCA